MLAAEVDLVNLLLDLIVWWAEGEEGAGRGWGLGMLVKWVRSGCWPTGKSRGALQGVFGYLCALEGIPRVCCSIALAFIICCIMNTQ
jgi:hypothetical protein